MNNQRNNDLDTKSVSELSTENKPYKTIKMYKIEKELTSSARSHCKVGKITSLKNETVASSIIPIDFKTEAFKKSNVAFTAKGKNL